MLNKKAGLMSDISHIVNELLHLRLHVALGY